MAFRKKRARRGRVRSRVRRRGHAGRKRRVRGLSIGNRM